MDVSRWLTEILALNTDLFINVLDGVTERVAREALMLGAEKLPIKTRIVTRML